MSTNKYTNTPPTWEAQGIEPSEELKSTGYIVEQKLPAPHLNWFLYKIFALIKEIQNKSVGVTIVNPEAEEGSGQECGEIFNSYTGDSANIANGTYSHAEGVNTTASGKYSHAEGLFTTASAERSHAEGYNTTASGKGSHAEGQGTTASGINSHAEGGGTTASGNHSHAGGVNSVANEITSLAHGYNVIANAYQAVFGKYNTSATAPTDASDTTGNIFVVGCGTAENETANALRITANGKCYGQQSFGSSGADYAEFFEWADGNADNEDRRGYFVTLDGDRIRKATAKDDFILGVISATPSIMGDVHSEQWHDMYLKDIFGEDLTETVEVEETTDETGKIIPAHVVTKKILNPEYDPSIKYISRDERKEWAAVGLIGKLIVNDDGTCEVNGYCKPTNGGIATKSETGYRVMKRLDDTHIQVLFR